MLLVISHLVSAAALSLPTGKNTAYSQTYGSAATVDQAAYESAAFWKEVADAVDGFYDGPELKRYRGWVANLINKPAGELKELETGQEVLTQYVFPGLQAEDVHKREPFPELPEVEAALQCLAPIAQEELADLLRNRPLVDDEAAAEAEDGTSTWNRAAWFGWQFMSLRDAKPYMPKTIAALEASVPIAHRFIGIARQRPSCRGTLHSDRRNYLLSTLLGLQVPKDQCAVVVPGTGEQLLSDGGVVVLDNTFKHYVYNNAKAEDRFVLMAEIWHPGLTEAERAALATTFAVKDKFTLTTLKQCPWGFSDDELERAIASKDILEIDFWRDITYGLDVSK